MDLLAQAYMLLDSMKKNLPAHYEVDQKYVHQFHGILDTVEKQTGKDLSWFRIPQSDLLREVGSTNGATGEVHYTGRTVIVRSDLLLKVDAVLSLFTFEGQKSKKGSIGFKAS